MASIPAYHRGKDVQKRTMQMELSGPSEDAKRIARLFKGKGMNSKRALELQQPSPSNYTARQIPLPLNSTRSTAKRQPSSRNLENSFDRVIRVLSQPAEVKNLGASSLLSSEGVLPGSVFNSVSPPVQYTRSQGPGPPSYTKRFGSYGLSKSPVLHSSHLLPSYLARNSTNSTFQQQRSRMTNASGDTAAPSIPSGPTDSSNSTAATSPLLLSSLANLKWRESELKVDPPHKKVEIFYDMKGDMFTAITTSSRYYGSHLWVEQADKLTRRFKALWVQQWYRHTEKWQVTPAFLTKAVRNGTVKNPPGSGSDKGSPERLVQSSVAAKPPSAFDRKPMLPSLSNLLTPQAIFAAAPPWPSPTAPQGTAGSDQPSASSKTAASRETENLEAAYSSGFGGISSLRPLGPLLLDATAAQLKNQHPRVIAIGDVHGCIDELQALLRQVGYSPGDQLVFLGDMVAKGPDSQAVVQMARELSGIAVRGNHEFEVLRWHRVLQKGGDPPPMASEHYRLARTLPAQDLEWLHLAPWYFSSEHLGALFVHAGFVHEKSLTRQNPRLMMNMRSILPDGTVTSRHFSSWPWARCWKGPQLVLFGHDAERGLQIHEHALGIDTGCVYGGRLTACILPERKLVSVTAKREYTTFRKRARSLPQDQILLAGKINKENQSLFAESALENDPESADEGEN